MHHNNILSSEMWHCAVGQAVPHTLNLHTSCTGLRQKMNATWSSKTSSTACPASITSQKTKKPSTSRLTLNHFNTHKRPQHDCLANINQSINQSINHSQLYSSTRCSVLFTFTVSTAFEKNNSNCCTICTVPYIHDATHRCGTRVSLFYVQKHTKLHKSRKATWIYGGYHPWFSEHVWLTSSFLCSQKTVASTRTQ